MNIAWSPHASGLFNNIIDQIEIALTPEFALKWHDRIECDVNELADFPELGPIVPLKCFASIPDNAENLHQLIISPYRVVYESVDNEIHILSIRHCRMLVKDDDTQWN